MEISGLTLRPTSMSVSMHCSKPSSEQGAQGKSQPSVYHRDIQPAAVMPGQGFLFRPGACAKFPQCLFFPKEESNKK